MSSQTVVAAQPCLGPSQMEFQNWEGKWTWVPAPNGEAVYNWYPLSKENQFSPVECHYQLCSRAGPLRRRRRSRLLQSRLWLWEISGNGLCQLLRSLLFLQRCLTGLRVCRWPIYATGSSLLKTGVRCWGKSPAPMCSGVGATAERSWAALQTPEQRGKKVEEK